MTYPIDVNLQPGLYRIDGSVIAGDEYILVLHRSTPDNPLCFYIYKTIFEPLMFTAWEKTNCTLISRSFKLNIKESSK